MRCLIDLDPDLADGLDGEARRLARAAATTTTLEAAAGPVALDAWLARACGGPGMLVLDGVVAQSARVGDRVAAELLGTGDLIQPCGPAGEELLLGAVSWRALAPACFAVLDRSFANRVRFWPELGLAILQRAGRRTASLNVQRAIAAQPRLDVRLALLLWHFAGRWGRVERGGVRLALPLTHQLLGQLVAAERPSVSHALARLAHSGLITGHGDEWHLHGTLEEQLPELEESGDRRAEQILGAVDAFRRAQAAG